MRLLDKRRNVIVNVDDNLVNEALSSGNYELRPGVRVPVKLPDGRNAELDSEEMPAALGMGIRYRTAQEDAEQAKQQVEQIKKEAYDKPGTAFALGAARGATLGLSDLAIRGAAELTGQEGAIEAAREIGERSPTASLAGEIAGGVASFVTPAGPLGALTRVAGAPVRAATALGEKAARAIGTTGQALNTTQKIGRAVTAGATEGALIGAGQTVSELALDDPELTAQKALANVALGTVFGGALSGAVRGGFEGVKYGTTQALAKVGEVEFIPKTAKELTGWLTEKYGKASALARGDFENTVEGVALNKEYEKLFARGSAEERKKLVNYIQNPQRFQQEFGESITAGTQVLDEIEKAASQTAKVQKGVLDADIGKVDKAVFKRFDEAWSDEAELADELGIEGILFRPELKGTKLEKAEKSARRARYDAIDTEARKLLNRLDETANELREGNAKYGGTLYDPGAIKTLDDTRAELAKRFFDETRTVSQINDAIVSAKNQIAEEGGIFSKAKDLMGPAERRASEKLTKVWRELKDASVNEELFGDFGAAVAKRADILSTIKGSVNEFNKLFFIRRKNRAGQWESIPNERAQELYIRAAGNTANFKKQLAFDDFMAGVKEAAEQLEPLPTQKLDDEIARLQKLAKQNSKRMVNKAQEASKERAAKYLDDQIKNMQAQKEAVLEFNESAVKTKQFALSKMDEIERQIEGTIEMKLYAKLVDRLESKTGRSLMGGLTGFGVGSLIPGGPIFEVAGAVIGGALQNPKSALKFASAIETAADGFDKMAQNATIKFRNFERRVAIKKGLSGKAIPAVRQTLIRDRLRIEPGERAEDDQKAFKKHRDTLNKLQGNREELYERLIDTLGDGALENPRLAIEVTETANRAIDFLESKIPKDPYPPGVYADDDFQPSPVELSHYSDYVQAVMRPKTLIKQIEAADINPRTVEAVQAVYPRLYEDLKTQVAGYLMSPKKIPYEQRVQLGYLFGVPSVKALHPDYLKRLLTVYSTQQQEDESQGMSNPSKLVGFREMQISEREQRV